jgi:hypothetical protein
VHAWRTTRRWSFLPLLGAITLPVAVSAQTAPSKPAEPSVRAALSHLADKRGLWGSLGLGRASAGLACDACASGSTYAYVMHGTVGIRLRPTFLLGAETFSWLNVIGGGVDRIARGHYLIARNYPFGDAGSASRRLFLQGGVGVASYRIADEDVAFRTQSPSVTLAAGYDWALRSVTITPQIAAVASTGGPLHSDRTANPIAERARLGLLRTSVALSWYRR